MRFAHEFDATHLVLKRSDASDSLALPVVYENSSYLVYALEPLSNTECSRQIEERLENLQAACVPLLLESGYFDEFAVHKLPSEWQGPEAVGMQDLAQTAWPLALQGHRGDFVFTRIPDEDGDVIRVSPAAGQAGENEMVTQFGVRFEDNGSALAVAGGAPGDEGDALEIQPCQVVVLSVWVRTSASPGEAEIFIQDQTEAWERSKTSIPGAATEWRRYVLLRSIRDGATSCWLGVHWTPRTEQDWLEMRDVEVFVYPFQPVAQP